MDFKNTLESRYEREQQYNKIVLNKYDYAQEGILQKCLPRIMFKGNPVLTTYLQLIDMRFIMLFKAVDKIKFFKHICKY